MSVVNIHGEDATPCDINGNQCSTCDIYGNPIGDYNIASSDYEKAVLTARDSWIAEARTDTTIVPVIVHADQHGKLSANNSLFKYLSKAISWNEISACIGLGDTCDYNVTAFQNMETCLSNVPKNKQINIWGNHDTWTYNWYRDKEVPTAEEMGVLNTYFDNSAFNGHHKYNDYGIEYMIDEAKRIKYVVIGGWEYDLTLGFHSHYVIGSDSMDYIIQMLSAQDDYDIVLLSHLQPFTRQTVTDWAHPPVEDGFTQGGAGGMDIGVGVVVGSETSIDQMLIDRQNKVSGTVKDSYGNVHSYDFTGCTSDLLCCFSGHEHCDKYMWQNGNIPIYLFDAYAYDNHPIYFVNVDRTKERLNIWKVDDVPTVYNFQIPFNKPIS